MSHRFCFCANAPTPTRRCLPTGPSPPPAQEPPAVGTALVDGAVHCLGRTFPLHPPGNRRLLLSKICGQGFPEDRGHPVPGEIGVQPSRQLRTSPPSLSPQQPSFGRPEAGPPPSPPFVKEGPDCDLLRLARKVHGRPRREGFTLRLLSSLFWQRRSSFQPSPLRPEGSRLSFGEGGDGTAPPPPLLVCMCGPAVFLSSIPRTSTQRLPTDSVVNFE